MYLIFLAFLLIYQYQDEKNWLINFQVENANIFQS